MNDKKPAILMTGVWNAWKHFEVDKSTGEVIPIYTATFAIITTKANELMAKVHNSKERMPTILSKELAHEWLSENLSEQRIHEIATYQFPSSEMNAYTIPKDFQQIANPKEEFMYKDLTHVV